MLATDHTVRIRPVAGIDAETVRVRPGDLPSKPAKPSKPLPPVISGMDAKTVRHRIVDVVVKPLPSAIADRIPRTVADRPDEHRARLVAQLAREAVRPGSPRRHRRPRGAATLRPAIRWFSWRPGRSRG